MNWKEKNWKFKSGVISIGFSFAFFALLVVIPFLNIESGIKVTASTVAFILGEILFYAGGFLLGKEIFNKYKYYFNPLNWFKKRPVEIIVDESYKATE